MTRFNLPSIPTGWQGATFLCCALLLSACGGGGAGSTQSAGVGGTGISTARATVQGKVTQFGSIYVNGVKFDTDDSQFSVDGISGATQDDLAIGMIVTLEVETLDGNYTGKAFKVEYDDEIQGPVAATPVDVPGSGGLKKTFEIFGQTITIDAIETVFDDTTFAGLDADDVVEISGYRTSETEITATYVEWKDTLVIGVSEVELRGTISNYDPLPVGEFILMPGNVSVTFDNDTDIEVENGGGLADGLFVEVEGIYQAGPSIAAEEIEEEDEGFNDDEDDVRLQGLVTDYNDLGDFKVNGQLVDASTAELTPMNAESILANGVEVEVRGDISGGVLFAERLELEEDEARLQAFVSSVGIDSFEVEFNGLAGTVEVLTDSQTAFEDESPLELPNFSIADMNPGDFVRVRGTESNDSIVAERVKRLDAGDPDDSELEGSVDSFVVDTSITVLGIAFSVNGATQYLDANESTITSGVFFGGLGIGDGVQIRDDDPANGIADEVELDD